jgi:hypothetical protein
MLWRPIWIAPTNTGAKSNTTRLVYLGLSRPHPCGTLLQIVAVPVRRKEERAHNAAI